MNVSIIFTKEGGRVSDIGKRLQEVERRIEAARRRSPYGQDVILVAVTKFHPLENMEEVLRLGVTQVGENRVQEMEEKHDRLTLPAVWHLQGHLQRNKVKKAVALADLIQSVDSAGILKEIDKRAEQAGKKQDVLLEFNISGEESKYGLSPKELPHIVEVARDCPHVTVKGLMCMAPIEEDAEKTRPVFKKAHALWEDLKTYFPDNQISILSMGMTQDFEIAIEEGATMVRVGTAIFGARQKGEEK